MDDSLTCYLCVNSCLNKVVTFVTVLTIVFMCLYLALVACGELCTEPTDVLFPWKQELS